MRESSIDPIWEKIFSERDWGQYPSEHVIRFVARNYYNKNRKTIRILDFGCGGGAHTWYLAREGFETYAFDGSPSAVEKTRNKLTNDDLEANIRVMDGCYLEYLDEYFDSVIDNVCVYANTLENIKTMYSEIYRILKSGGKLLTVAFSKNTTGYSTGEYVELDTYCNIREGALAERGIAHVWEANELIELLTDIGFKDIKQEYIKYSNYESVVELLSITGVK